MRVAWGKRWAKLFDSRPSDSVLPFNSELLVFRKSRTAPLRFSTVSENTSRCRRNLCRFLGYFRNRVHSWTFGHSHQEKLQFLSPNVHRVLVPFDISDLFVDQLR